MGNVQTKKANNKRKTCWTSIHFNSGLESVRMDERIRADGLPVFFLCVDGDCGPGHSVGASVGPA